MKFLNVKNKINLLIEKAKHNAAKSITEKIVGFISLIESIIFPIPVDPLLAILVLNNKQKYIKLTFFCTLASVIGGLVGWLLGYVIGEEIEELLTIIPWIKNDSFNTVKTAFDEHGILIIFLGAFTPLPYKIITITSGMAGINVIGFVLMSLIGRGIRFFIVAYLTKIFGMPALLFLQTNLLISSSILGIAIILFSIYIF